MTAAQLQQVKGMSQKRVTRILASLEFGKGLMHHHRSCRLPTRPISRQSISRNQSFENSLYRA
jgi:hypothetical protein